jgi:hypothetical protein
MNKYYKLPLYALLSFNSRLSTILDFLLETNNVFITYFPVHNYFGLRIAGDGISIYSYPSEKAAQNYINYSLE